ncbi:fibronectin type III domain-containing protein [Hymenobacter antarcticus]|uniref:Por secretion system C-terminal sorting domain-containing protein n=1 Tax=Hymenobacter antarcticus TaxID=486270 RepID=A0ABP7R3A3_9BACT
MKYFSSLGPPSATRRYGWLALLWLLCFGTAAAQTSTIGSTAVPVVAPATGSYFYGPIYRSTATSAFNFSRYAHLYTPAELNIPTGAVITELAWLKSDAGTLTGNNIFTVLLANSAQTTLVTTQPWGTLTTGATQVYTSSTQQVSGVAGDYFSVTLSQPFVYTGGNLLVLADHEKQGTASAVINFVTNPAVGFALGTAASTAFSNTTALTAASYGDRRPTLRVTYAPGGPCTSPPTAGTTRASAAAVCAGSTVNFSLLGASFGTGQTYQWQVSTNGTTFADITGATSPAYTSGPLTATRTFRAVLTCGGQSASSTPVTVTVNQATFASLPLVEDFEGTWADACATRDVPTNSWRNIPSAGDASWRRDDDGVSASWTSPTIGVYTPVSSQGARSARFHSYYAGANALGTLDLYINLSAAGNKVLQFDYLNTAGNDSLQVQVSTDGGTTFGTPLLRLGVSGTVAQGWQPQNVSITSTSATTIVRFRTKVTGTFTSDIGLDNVRLNVLSGVPTCATNLLPAAGATNVSRGTALTWQAGTGVTTGYDVYFGTTATPPLVSPNQPGTSYTPAALLAAATTYYYQIVPRNANGPAVGCGVQSFTTNSVPVYCNPSTVFLSGFCGSNNVTEVTVGGSGLNATGLTCGTVTTSFGTSAYTSYPVAGSTTGTLLQGLTYPVTVNNNGNSILSVWIDFNQNGTFEATEWTQIATTTTANTAVTVNITVPANAVTGLTGMRVRSRGTGNANGAGDACSTFGGGETKDFVVTIGSAPACAPPTGLTATNVSTTSATLAFGAGSGTATNYIIQYGVSGFTPGGTGSTTINTTNLSAPITGLTANTTYQFYVTKDCGGGATSQVAGPFTFTTLCIAPVYATLPVLESFENTWVNGCGTRDIPTTSWRNIPTTGNNSWRREDDGVSAAWVNPASYAYTPTGSQGTHSARFHSGQASSGLIGTLDLFVNLSAAGAKRLSFDYINTSGSDSLVVQLSNDGGATFSRLAGYNQSGTAAAFVTQVLPISSTSATAVIRFRGRADFGVTDIGLDNIILESATGCLTPANLTVTGTTATSATVSWLAGGTGTYSVVYGPTGFNPATGGTTVSGLTAPPYTITGLTASTAYQFYVTLNCAAGANSGTAGPVAFSTACVTPVYATLPVLESFENTWISRCATNEVPTNNWRNTPTTGNNSWRREDDGVSAAWVNPASYAYTPTGSQGTHSARFHSGQASSGLIGTLDLFVNLSAAGAKRLSFDYINTSGSDSLVVQLSTDGGATFSRLTGFNQSGTVATGFVTQVLPISSTSATAVIRFRGRADFGVTDIGLDNIILESATGCLTPAALTATTTTTTASLSWLTGGTGTYSVVYGPTGFNPATGGTTVSGIVAPPYTVTGLTPGTTYQFYVTLNCAAGANSGTAGPATFSTQILNDEPCGAIDLPVSNTCNPLNSTMVGATATTGVAAGTCTNFPTATPLDVWYKFTTAATGPTSTSVRLTVTGASANTIRAYSGVCTGTLTFVSCITAANGTTTAPNLDLTALTPGTTYLVRVSTYSTTQTNLGPITICASPVPNCPTPAGLGTGTITNTTAVLTWSAPALAGSTFTVTYGPTGFTPGGTGSTTLSGITTQTTTLTGLQAATVYQFYVQQVCGGFNGSSAQAGPFSFTTPLTAPANDEPCGALGLGTGTVSGSNVGATTSVQNGINLPACSSAQLPRDVWFFFTPTGTSTTLNITGTTAGMVRVYSSPNCANGPFNLITCASSGANNTAITGPISVTGLTAGQRYYVAVSGYGSSDVTGAFTLAGSGLVTATKAQAETSALLVYPNPSNTGQLTLRLAGLRGPGQASLLNALGQLVRTAPLAGTAEQVLPTRGLAAGVYTLRVAVDGNILTRKVVLE